MARSPYATHTYDTPQKSSRNGNTPQYIVIHHAASQNFSGVVDMEMGAKQVSSTLIIDGEKIASMFDEAFRAWSLSSAYWDSVSLSVETINDSGAPSWSISEASYRSLAKVVADWCKRYNIPCNRERVLGHREVYTRYGASYSTACPGGIDLDRVVRDANTIITTGALELEMTPEQNRMLTSVYDAIFNGGPSMKDNTKSVSQTLAEINSAVNKAVFRDGENVSQIQDNADTNTMVRKLLAAPATSGGAVIDYAALAKAVNDDLATRITN